MTTTPYTIGPLSCAPGERAEGLIPVGTSSYGVELGIPLLVVNGTAPGPVLCVDAGVHGDEYDGQETVRRIVAETDPESLRGTLVGIPCMNTAAFEAASRVSGLDHANLNRIFPGDADGSFSLRLAATFVAQVVPAIDALIDLHTGGTYGEIAPLTIVQGGFEELAMPIGLAAGHQLIWKGGKWGGTVRHPTLAAGKPAITIEVGGATYREAHVEAHADSVRNIMRQLGMIDGEVALRETYTEVSGTFARAIAGGFFLDHVAPGDECKAGDLLATIVDHYGHTVEEVRAPQDGIVLWQRRIRTVRPGDEVVIFGQVHGEIRP
ncbi:M14 family metallopeptidase [Micromonospora sp. KC213]|uniref:succinylglutamate desuccinylase/aspartoacylase family protein n=1 Tax=Micromonospora sp. KC213 TaxID=2530378 RepID=UPI00104A72CA|nr:M14 family metallopeptidase [Micromonospora sp. KC213]TDC39590.1 ethanolamine utilization protein EutE [Micromonospora sp. KC213]